MRNDPSINKPFGRLVLLSSYITVYTLAAYLRNRLLRPSREV